MRPKPGQRRGQGALEVEAPPEALRQRHPVETLVIVERGRAVGPTERSLDVLALAGKDTLPVLVERIRARPRIVADATPSGDATDGLLDEQRQSGFDRNAHEQRPVWREHPPEALD